MNIYQIIWMFIFYGVLTPILMIVSFSVGQLMATRYKPIWKVYIIFILIAVIISFGIFQLCINNGSLIICFVWIIPGIVGIILVAKGKGYNN
jgi:hypothetical protein